MKEYKYIEIVDMDTMEVVKRMDVSNKSENTIEKIERGLLRQIRTGDFFTKLITTKTPMKTTMI